MKKISLGNGQHVMRFESGVDDFYFDSGNILYAADALLDIAEGRAELLYIYGPFGCGKSHLLRGFFRDYKAAHPDEAVRLMSAKSLCDELMAAMCTGSVASLAERYEKLKLLVVEDVDILTGKQSMQNVFLQLFERLRSVGCSVVLSGGEHIDAFPELCPLMDCCGGMVVELSYPDADCRRNYAVAVCVEWGVYISLEEAEALALDYAAIPQLRGAIFSRALKASAA